MSAVMMSRDKTFSVVDAALHDGFALEKYSRLQRIYMCLHSFHLLPGYFGLTTLFFGREARSTDRFASSGMISHTPPIEMSVHVGM